MVPNRYATDRKQLSVRDLCVVCVNQRQTDRQTGGAGHESVGGEEEGKKQRLSNKSNGSQRSE